MTNHNYIGGSVKVKMPVYTLSQAQLNNIKQQVAQDTLDKAMVLLLGLPVMVLHDKYSLLMKKEVDGKSREERFTDLLLDLYDSFNRDYITLDDIKECLKDECGIDILELKNRK